jgi:hypothetical protein
MSKLIKRCALAGLAALGMCLTLSLSGCGGSNENERENARTAAPGIPAENPNESFAERRGRTRLVPKQVQKIEARNQAAAEKKAAAAK